MLDILAAAAGAATPPAWVTWAPIAGMVVIFWFLIIRPQMRQQKEHRERVGGLKRGDEIVTAGGIVGKVTKVDDVYVEVEISKGVKVRAVKHTITEVLQPGGSPAAND